MLYKNNQLLTVIILAVVFGLSGGIVGELVARVYLLENNLNMPFFGEIYFPGNSNGGANVVFRDARKVIVEQDVKIAETAAAARTGIVGIFKRLEAVTPAGNATGTAFKIDSGYRLDEELGQGFILTSDGWLVTGFMPKDLAGLGQTPEGSTAAEKIYAEYAVLSADKMVYAVDSIIPDPVSGYAFWHISARDLPVRQFAPQEGAENGQTLLALNWEGWTYTAQVAARNDGDSGILESDKYLNEIILNEKPPSALYGSFVFNLDGALAGLVDDEGVISDVNGMSAVISGLLKEKAVKRASLGVSYIDLSGFASLDPALPKNGALLYAETGKAAVVRGSAAEAAGLKAGDVITSINNREMNGNNRLGAVVAEFLPGDEITLSYLRAGERKETTAKLGELKK